MTLIYFTLVGTAQRVNILKSVGQLSRDIVWFKRIGVQTDKRIFFKHICGLRSLVRGATIFTGVNDI